MNKDIIELANINTGPRRETF